MRVRHLIDKGKMHSPQGFKERRGAFIVQWQQERERKEIGGKENNSPRCTVITSPLS
jgi:hypothetical protein